MGPRPRRARRRRRLWTAEQRARAMIKLRGLIAAAALSLPLSLEAQEIAPETQALVQELTDAALARGLPTHPILQKAMEGSAKGVPADRVEAAMRLVFAQLDTAAMALRGAGMATPDTDVIASGGFAVNAGLRGSHIRELARMGETASPSDMSVALRVAGTLSAMGVPSVETVE